MLSNTTKLGTADFQSQARSCEQLSTQERSVLGRPAIATKLDKKQLSPVQCTVFATAIKKLKHNLQLITVR
jgi:hypothetical protein